MQVYKLDVPDDQDPILELVISPSRQQTRKLIDDSDTLLAGPACPRTVGVLPDGLTVIVFCARQAINSTINRAGGGRRVELKLPQRVVPSSAKSFFCEAKETLTVRATIAAA